ncbi:MAG: phosphatase PAP2 family protein [Saccharofermentanales bacterium]
MISSIIGLDQKIIFMIQSIHNPILDWVMLAFTILGNGGMIWVVISLFLIISKKTRYIGIIAISALILSAIIGDGILKPLFHRPRPFTVFPEIKVLIKEPTIYSFPSGHTASSFAAAFVLSTYLRKYSVIFWILAGLIAISRLYLFMHYPTDVIAGAILGILCAIAMIYFGKVSRLKRFFISENETL